MRLMNKLMAACLMAAPLLFTGCQDEDLFDAGNRVVEGIPTQVTLGYASLESTIETRAAQGKDYENRIENIYLFVFNSAGGRVDLNRNLFTSDAGLYPEKVDPSLGKGTLQFVCPSLNDATIVAIANVADGSTQTAYNVTPTELDAVTTFDELKAKIMKMDSEAVTRGALFMMTGYAEDEAGNTAIDIAGTENGTGDPLKCTLKLERTDAKVEVNVTSEPANSAWTDFSFRPQTWRVVRVPMQSLILPADEGDADGDGCTYFDTDEAAFETLAANENNTSYTGGGFVFYMPENRKKPTKVIETNGLTQETQYALREKWNTQEHTDSSKPGQTVENVSFANANPNSTYLEITGRLTYKDEDGKAVDANTRYYVHLGYAGKDPNDYNTLRNRHYIYTLTVKGINNIEVEVEGGDPRPGHEGDVVISEQEVFDFDCHYDRRLIHISQDVILSEGLGWGVSTIYSNGIHKIGEEIPTDMRDYRWIKFAINKEYGVDASHYVKYPGDQNYDDPFVTDGADDNASSPYYTTDGRHYPNARLRDINQLLTDLKEDAESGGTKFFENGSVAVTVFVDENLYTKDPRQDNAQTNLLLWKDCVNKPDRMLHIIAEDAKYSADGNSSVVHSIYTFKQKSIRTIYNTASDVQTAWGLETVTEGDRRLPVDKDMETDINDLDNGRLNTWMYIEDNRVNEGSYWRPDYRPLRWTDVLNTDAHYELQDNRRNVFYATLMRNRDLNGDNVIDENEVRWYLAAINQLTDIYIGEYALDQEARLYPWNPRNGDYPPNGGTNSVFWHYASSTYQETVRSGWSSYNYPYVVWAEEGPSKGNYGASENSQGSNYAYRCLRNLGLAIDDIDGKIVDFVQVTNNNGTYTFDLSYLDPKALRSYYVPGAGTYTVHNEKSEHNLPYRKFTVSAEYYPSDAYNWNVYQTYNPCEDAGYRVPNLRELLIYTSRLSIPTNMEMLASFTSFSMCDFGPYGSNRMGYSFNPDDGSMGPANHQCRVRGVKDEPR